ncbi:PIG-L deacetylase family protein [Singulisphaera sp. Ch08]|uniref:PIG-L deacetylase family protein n=1 Tax=Singulisphaera sp. Ch08 TaxID=3120278 RepID=A0AAU7CLT9_9BACT
MKKRVLVIAPHPDDEVLGAGGVMARFAAEGADVFVAVVTKGGPPLFTEDFVEQARREAKEAHQILGVKETRFLDLPAAGLDSIPHRTVNAALVDVVKEFEPDLLFIPFNGDIHLDHQLIFLSSLVAVRPGSTLRKIGIYAYETLSETNWNAPYITPSFVPNTFFDITEYLDLKMAAMKAFSSQVKPFPNERSLETLRALAMLRGSTVGAHAAEAFVLIRAVS